MSIIINFKKNFADWFLQKPKIDCNSNNPPFVKEGQIYWCRIGENIGTEISGKGEIFTRPVVIHTKLSKFTFLVIPTSTKIKDGSWFVKFTHNKITMIACLNQVRVVDYRRLSTFVGYLDDKDFAKISLGFNNLYK